MEFTKLAEHAGKLIETAIAFSSTTRSSRARLIRYDSELGPTTPLAKSLVFQAVVLLLVPGVAAIAARVRGRGSAAVVSGAVAYGAGILRVFSFLVVTGLEVSLAASGPIDGRIALGSSPAAVPAAVLGLGLFHLVGLPWLSFGMVRTRQLLLIAAVVATVGTVCAFFGSTRIETVGWVVSGLALAYIGTVFRPRVPQALSVGSGSLTPPAPDRRPLRERAGRHRARPRHRPPLIETDPASTRGPQPGDISRTCGPDDRP